MTTSNSNHSRGLWLHVLIFVMLSATVFAGFHY